METELLHSTTLLSESSFSQCFFSSSFLHYTSFGSVGCRTRQIAALQMKHSHYLPVILRTLPLLLCSLERSAVPSVYFISTEFTPDFHRQLSKGSCFCGSPFSRKTVPKHDVSTSVPDCGDNYLWHI
ncbi:hypothetical protein ILYODFUR_002207 [Ilyodon furcidens]|uniref:Uncharacterized protein n=1 Tax=Ilyodon furcidens TaxID=33524 RepID=A0ABV0UNP2_9TELE